MVKQGAPRSLHVKLGLFLLLKNAKGFNPGLPLSYARWTKERNQASRPQLSLNDDWAALTSRITDGFSKGPAVPQAYPASTASQQSAVTNDLNWQQFLTSESDFAFELDQVARNIESSIAEPAAQFFALPLCGQVGAVLIPITLIIYLSIYNVALTAPENFREGMEPYSRGKGYDPIQAKAYYSRHKVLVLQRASQVFRLSNKFLHNILFDKYTLRDEERNRAKRANELLELVTKLGPTAIKFGQALSVRPDLIPEEYAKLGYSTRPSTTI